MTARSSSNIIIDHCHHHSVLVAILLIITTYYMVVTSHLSVSSSIYYSLRRHQREPVNWMWIISCVVIFGRGQRASIPGVALFSSKDLMTSRSTEEETEKRRSGSRAKKLELALFLPLPPLPAVCACSVCLHADYCIYLSVPLYVHTSSHLHSA